MALAPALIMMLVGSLSFYLINVFYHGPHLVRLYWVMFWFVVGIVLIARISIEIDGERAAIYGLGLAGAVALVSMKLVGSPVLVWFLLALVWWCAHQLTLDCTLIDDSEDASGEGLMQIVGLDRPPAELERPAAPARRSGFWRRLVLGRQPGEPHAPGLLVVYFSLAALPLFGIGQMFVPASDTESRAFAFWCMCLYVASALGLLATTSLLGLRRYLRQRGLAMPAQMAGIWLGAAAVVVSVVLVAGSLLPRPGASWFATPRSVAQGPRQPASQYAVVREGTGEGAGAAGQDRAGAEQQSTSAAAGNGPRQRNEGGAAGSQTEQQATPGLPAEQVGASSQQGSQEAPQDTGQQGMPGQDRTASPVQQTGREGERTQDPSSGENEGAASGTGGMSSPGSGRTQSSVSKNNPTAKSGGQGPSGTGQESASQSRQVDTSGGQPWRPPVSFSALATMFKWLVYAALAAAAVFLLLRHGRGLVRSLAQLVKELADFLERLLGRRGQQASVPAAPPAPQPRPFAHFANPFVTGEAARRSPRHLLIYTYAALQAWAEEQGMPPDSALTPMEFADRLGLHQPRVADEAAQLALVYSRMMYGRREPDAAVVSLLRRVWDRIAQPAELSLVGGKGEG